LASGDAIEGVGMQALSMPLSSVFSTVSCLRAAGAISPTGRARFEVLLQPSVDIGDVVNHPPADLRKAPASAAAPESDTPIGGIHLGLIGA
jgi:hypothetical protein